MPVTKYEYVKRWRARPENKGKRTEEARRYYAKHPDKVAARSKAYRERHPDRAKAANARLIARRKADPEGQRIRFQRWRAKREAERRALTGRERPKVCDICRECNIRIVFDHCHASGDFRGWLCDRCNRVLGLMRDDPKLLRRMARYLEKADGKAERKSEEKPTNLSLCWGEPLVSDRE